MDEEYARTKRKARVSALGKLDGLLVAFSGGVDSSFLFAVAKKDTFPGK